MIPSNRFPESIPPAYVAWRAGTTVLFLIGSYPPKDYSKIPALVAFSC